MRTTKERDEFLEIAASEGLPEPTARRLMRYASTLQRLAERECNGDDWRDERGPRHMATAGDIPLCLGLERTGKERIAWRWAAVSCSTCRSMRLEQLAAECLPEGFRAITQGDPRGAVLKITVPSGRTNDWGREGICVP